MIKNVTITDLLMILGLSLLGTGLFFCYGKGVSLAVVGSLLFLMGFLSGAMKAKK